MASLAASYAFNLLQRGQKFLESGREFHKNHNIVNSYLSNSYKSREM